MTKLFHFRALVLAFLFFGSGNAVALARGIPADQAVPVAGRSQKFALQTSYDPYCDPSSPLYNLLICAADRIHRG